MSYNKESHNKWYQASGKEYYKKYYELNKDRVRVYQKNYYELNKETIRIRQRKYYHLNYYLNKNYFKNYYEKNRLRLLQNALLKKQYGNKEVNIKQGSFIISFK